MYDTREDAIRWRHYGFFISKLLGTPDMELSNSQDQLSETIFVYGMTKSFHRNSFLHPAAFLTWISLG